MEHLLGAKYHLHELTRLHCIAIKVGSFMIFFDRAGTERLSNLL